MIPNVIFWYRNLSVKHSFEQLLPRPKKSVGNLNIKKHIEVT